MKPRDWGVKSLLERGRGNQVRQTTIGPTPSAVSSAQCRPIVDNARKPYALLEDAQVYYQEHGAGDPLLLVHGFALVGDYEAATRFCSTPS